MSFTGVDTSGTNGSGAIGATGTGNANPGLPTASLVTTRGGSLVLGVGNDWDHAVARTPGTGQSLVNQYLAPVADTYWVQTQNSPTPLGGMTVTINDTAPSGDRYNLTIVEVLPATGAGGTTFNISGAITPGANGSGATVTLSQGGTTIVTATANSSGNYTFTGQANGTYSVTPSKAGFTMSPTSQTVTVNGGNVLVQNFTATAITWSISGTITPAANGAGALVSLSGPATGSTTADSGGNYSFSGLANGTYAVAPIKTGFTFNPTTQSVTVNGGNATVPNFTATAIPTYTISGTITGDGGGANVALTQSGTLVGSAVASSSGNYGFSNVANGTYSVTPSKTGFTYIPTSQTVTVNGNNVSVPNFTAQGTPRSLLFPDLRDILPPGKMSVVQTVNGKQFQYTHDTFNAGPGPLVIQPVFNSASGAYQGTQYVYSQSPSGVWTLSQKIPVAGAFIFDSDHGHFHFPFVTYGLYAMGANGGPGTPVAVSAKVSYCITDSFIYDPTLPNAGALGNLGSCSDPTSLRGLDIGAVDEYDQNDAGQSILINSLPDGTYWLRALVDPNNFLAEADKTNNETDVELTITGTTVQVLKTIIPVLNPPPSITLTSPSGDTTVSGAVQLTANTSTISGVQYLIDGQAFGSVVSNSPYALSWDTTTVPNGMHWLAAQTTDSTGIVGTSPVVQVSVANGASAGPTVQLTSPANGSILSATVALYATVGSSQPISNVVFYVDFVQVGSLVNAPPYMVSWDTIKVADGQHVITVSATDFLGNAGKSAPVTVTVNNSHPANLIGKEVTLSVDGAGALTTPLFSTTTPSDLLVAFVAYDGPANAAQTASVSGAGLTWMLLERSNTQLGTAEIWSARTDGLLSNVTVTSQPGAGSSYHGSLTVIAFTNAAGTSVVGRTGARNGAPDIPLPGVIAGDWVFAVGNDWDKAIARAPVNGQVLVHQDVDTQVGDTYWVQSTMAPATANALVDIHDSAPTADRWNYAAVEIVATHH